MDHAAHRTHEQIVGSLGDGDVQPEIRLRKASGVRPLAAHLLDAAAHLDDVSVVALLCCQRGRTGFYGKPNLAEIEQKAGVNAALKVPSQYVGVEHIPC